MIFCYVHAIEDHPIDLNSDFVSSSVLSPKCFNIAVQIEAEGVCFTTLIGVFLVELDNIKVILIIPVCVHV